MKLQQPHKMTPEEQADYQQRVKYFNAEMTGLLAKYKLAIMPMLQIMDDSQKVGQSEPEQEPGLASSKD